MEKGSRSTWLNKIIDFIGEYAGVNPGYSPRVLAEALSKHFSISLEDAIELADLVKGDLVKKEPAMGELGLAAIELNLTYNCNLTCEYCFVHDKNYRDRMSFATAKKAVDLLMERAAFPVVSITLIGGEPLLEFNLIKEIVSYTLEAAKERNLAINWAITTNGTLVNETMLRYFAKHKISLLLSMDGGPETHDRYRRTRSGKGTWHKIAGLVPLIKKHQPWLGARMTVSTEAIDRMREDFNQLVGLEINQFIIAPAQGAVTWGKEQIEQFGINLVAILEDYHELKRRGVPIFIDEFEKDENEYRVWGCRAGNTSLSLAPNGDVSPCSKMLGLTDEKGKYIVGNVNTGIDIKLLEPFRNPISRQPGQCRDCFRKCTGGCYAVNFEQTGDHFLPSEENCLFWVVCQETKKLSKMMNTACSRCSGMSCYPDAPPLALAR